MSVSAARIVAAILLPPLGAYLAAGPGRDFLIACVLTIVAFVPGMIFALFVVLSRRASPALA